MISSGHRSQRKHEEAEPLFKRALVICERVLGPEHPYTGSSSQTSSWALLQQRDG
jgi:Tetratricopeptide repeat